MSDEDDDKAQQSTDEEQHTPSADDLSDEGKEKVEQMTQAYDDERPTAVLPGTDNTITGVAVNEWLDDDGNPKFGKDKQQEDGAGKPDEDAGEEQAKDAS
ncbi:hypothetical protein PT015_07545 [Candidatus Mycobacterium wuenschmannii]|uniref:PAS domain S-box/diguanylate cyclase (GGDEF) domain-containing protein n=1 Tax=Candidatus Mycobacterium wuenschmannii TaxID=3027808 RepID=A0ABY8W679_9MYCO|nr:hypothetical protein [Candidatus Mycobacterium wuenschmannii]WIM89289.1 hypothetical protein PT015_07545 [Candidatus Mycobacterium wuenschmannii]